MDALQQLIHELSKLPGIGEKSATRLAYHLLHSEQEDVQRLATVLMRAKQQTKLCNECFTFTEREQCSICASNARQKNSIRVVDRPSDVSAIESSGKFQGVYHVLHGVLSPIDGIGPEQLKMKELLARVQLLPDFNAVEIILALNPSVEGEATALYLTRVFKPIGIKLSKIAYGLPMGGILEYADRMTIAQALENRMQCS